MNSFFSTLKIIFEFLFHHKKNLLLIIFFFQILTSILDLAMIGIIFIVIPEIIFDSTEISFTDYFPFLNKSEFIILSAFIVIIAYLMRIFVSFLIKEITASVGILISRYVFTAYFTRPYSYFLQSNSSELLGAISFKINATLFGGISPLFKIIISSINFLFILFALVILSSEIVVYSIIWFALIFVVLFFFIRKFTYTISLKTAASSNSSLKIIQEAILSMRSIILNDSLSLYSREFDNENKILRAEQAKGVHVSTTSQVILEASIFLPILLSLFYFWNFDNDIVSKNSALISAFIFGVIRLLPNIIFIQGAFTNISANEQPIKDVYDFWRSYKRKTLKEKKYENFSSILFQDINFNFNKKKIFSKLNISFSKGEKILVTGPTGIGKSTFLDIFSGLLQVDAGKILLSFDQKEFPLGSSWKSQISYLSQQGFLRDDSVINNVFEFLPDYWIAKNSNASLDDFYQKAREQLSFVELLDELSSSEEEIFDYRIGERGNKLSGGQKQRLLLAQSLVKNKSIIIIDEGLNALNEDLESKILNKLINMKELTLLYVSHRNTKYKGFDSQLKFEVNPEGGALARKEEFQ